MEDGSAGATDRFTGGGDDSNNQSENNEYKGARGLPPELIEDLEKQFGFDKPPVERFLTMLWNYIRFDFGESYFRSITIIDLILEKMPVSITLGLWSTLLAYLVSIPLGIRKAIKDGSAFDVWTSGIIIAAYAIPGLLFGILLIVLFAGGSYWQIFPLRGLASEGAADFGFFERIADYFWHAALPILTSTIAAFATLTLLTKNSFLDEINKQYVMTARAKGLTEFNVFYGHVFRNAMLIVISGFPALFVGIFFGGSLIIEVIFSLDGLGLLGYEAAINRDYQVFFATLYIFALIGLLVKLLSDLTYIWIDPRIDFGSRET
jgi:microcin C transport system permease protein